MNFKYRLAQLYQPDRQYLPNRRYDLDWLRVLAFGLLIFYHSGMLYVENWGFHIKSQYLSSQLESLMLLVNPWRMPILWMISGIAIRFVLAKVELGHFIKWRSYRLLLPLLFGILVVVPPQLYYEISSKEGLTISYWEFLGAFWQLNHPLFENYQAGIWPHIDVNHLWYLRELWTFSLYLLLLVPLLNSKWMNAMTHWLAAKSGWLSLLILLIPIVVIEFSLEETREALGMLFLCFGFVLGWHPQFWQKLRNNAFRLLIAALVCYLLLAYFYNVYWVGPNRTSDQLILSIGQIIYGFDRLVWVLAILGLGFRLLNKPSTQLSYFNDAVYPFYILHQTFIIALGYELSRFNLGGPLESLLVISLTFVALFVCYELIRRSNILRPVFGLKLLTHPPLSLIAKLLRHKVTQYLIGIILVLFGLEILL